MYDSAINLVTCLVSLLSCRLAFTWFKWEAHIIIFIIIW